MYSLAGEENSTNLYNTDSLSTLKVCELDLYLQHRKMTFKGTKKQKIAIIKAHIGSKIIASISVQEAEAITAQTASDSESDFVEQSIGSFTVASSESSDLSDFSECSNAVMEATTEASSSCYGHNEPKCSGTTLSSGLRLTFKDFINLLILMIRKKSM